MARANRDPFARQAKLQNLKSRAAFKLLQINDRHRLFKPGQTVLDLGFAPGSWSQVAADLVRPKGRVLGVDVIPAMPPKGVNTIQGDFLNEDTRREIRTFLRDPERGRVRRRVEIEFLDDALRDDAATGRNYLDHVKEDMVKEEVMETESKDVGIGDIEGDTTEHDDKVIDVVLSDMSAPWEMLTGLHHNSISNPYRRMMNTSGNRFRDHAGSMVSF